MHANLQILTTAALLPPAYAAEMTARTAALWARRLSTLMPSTDATGPASAPVDLVEMEADETTETDLVALAVETTVAEAEETTVNLLDAVAEATGDANRAAQTSASTLAEASTTPAAPKTGPLPGAKPFAAE